MSRKPRPFLPGVPFHLTARIQGHAPLFAGREAEVVQKISSCSGAGDARLMAYAVMPNHLHIILVQGSQPLSRVMQPLLTRLALQMRRVHGCEGHVFERRYGARPCADVDYFRAAVAYVHLNPVRKNICCEPSQYEWSSHSIYAGLAPCGESLARAVETALRIYAINVNSTLEQCRADYLSYTRWRVIRDAYLAGNPELGDRATVDRPWGVAGDAHWNAEFGTAASLVASRVCGSARTDLRDTAMRVLSQVAPEMSLDVLRAGGRSRPVVAARREIIIRALDAGHRPSAVAAFLSISDTAVWQVSRGR